MLVPNLNMRDVESIAELLDVFNFASRCRSKRENSEMRVLMHEFPDNLCADVVALPVMRLVCVFVVSQGEMGRR